MAAPLLRFVILLVALACCCSVSSVAAEARALRHQVYQSDDSTTQTDSVAQTAITSDSVAQTAVTSHSSSASTSGSGATTTSTINTAASAAESTETVHEGPTIMSFGGPAIAGVLAIVLIGAVVAFKNRMGK